MGDEFNLDFFLCRHEVVFTFGCVFGPNNWGLKGVLERGSKGQGNACCWGTRVVVVDVFLVVACAFPAEAATEVESRLECLLVGTPHLHTYPSTSTYIYLQFVFSALY